MSFAYFHLLGLKPFSPNCLFLFEVMRQRLNELTFELKLDPRLQQNQYFKALFQIECHRRLSL